MHKPDQEQFLIVLGLVMLLIVAAVNSYIAFFSDRPYTGAMFAASGFWTIVGWIILRVRTD